MDRHRPDWTEAEDALLGSASDAKVAKLINRTVESVRARRNVLGVAIYRRGWPSHGDALLGTMPDHAVAAILGCTSLAVSKRRHELGIQPTRPRRWGSPAAETAVLMQRGNAVQAELRQIIAELRWTAAKSRELVRAS